MPQMSPYNWLYLFMIFNMTIIFLNTLIHFYKFFMPLKLPLIHMKKINYYWKW